ncbi:unnamed protein product [marine sediment metagenome]|uniref:Homing endonuclease LAGLIDADG domain-containing protein n=1 Tax=marine sediment metagenome TaxID=412755 RepID=X1M524_9ZZZZ
MLRKDTLNYLAGFFDGEGCIYINKQKNVRNPKRSITYQGAVEVANTKKEQLLLFSKYFGGKIRCYYDVDRPNGKYFWRIVSRDAVKFCKVIKGYLLTKEEQAEVVIELHKTMKPRGNAHVPDDIIKYREQLYQEMRTLNKTKKVT